jgi:acyl dehydratase
MHTVRLKHTTRPRVLPIYARGLVMPRGGLAPERALPAIHSEWRGFKMDKRHLKQFTDICRLAPSDIMPLVYPLIFAFPLHVSIVGHREFPLLYVRMMQVRNHVIQHRPIDLRETIDISCAIVGQRVVAKGLEMDIYSGLEAAGEHVWESVHTYFFPGNFGEPDPPSPLAQLPHLSEDTVEKVWTMPNRGGFCFGLMAGDYNPIHYLAPYARRMGFRRDFAHAQLTLALCIRHLPPFQQDEPVRLDVAIKGPVYYGSNVTMKYSDDGKGPRFDLYCEDNARPCISGSMNSAKPDFGLIFHDFYSWVSK